MNTRHRTAEEQRLHAAGERSAHWKRWGSYLSERQWGTVGKDYSPHGTAWDSFPHAAETLEPEIVDRLPGFKRRMQWFIDHHPDFRDHVPEVEEPGRGIRHQTGWTALIAKLVQQLGKTQLPGEAQPKASERS
ncbi:MAG: hypothetical protein ACREK9_16930 [Candidatus Rokuibacteriota bacterium]